MPETRFEVDLSKGSADQTIKIGDSALALTVTEAAVEAKPIAECVAKLDGRAVSTSQTVEGLAPGRYSLTVEAADHEPYKLMLDLKPGKTAVVATLTLTPLETYRRFYEAGKYHRDDVTYAYIHPDERAVLSPEKWKEWGSGWEDKSITFGEVRVLPSWASPVTKRTYSNVAEIDRTIEAQVIDPKYSDYGKVYTDNHTQHWAKMDGLWYMLHSELP
jgi:hypothetical protein